MRALLTDHLSSQLPSQQVHHYQNLIFWQEEKNPLNLLGNADFCCDSQFAIKRLFCFSHRKRKRFVVSLVSWLSQADNSQDTRDRGAKFSKRCCCFRRRSGAAGEGNEATRARPELVEARADSQQHASVHIGEECEFGVLLEETMQLRTLTWRAVKCQHLSFLRSHLTCHSV